MKTLEQFIEENPLKLKVEHAARNPHMTDFHGDHWKCTVRNPATGSRFTLTFSKGYGHNGAPPTLAEILDCLASDAAGVDNASGSFEDWANEYGYDPDSRQAEKIYKACSRQAAGLKKLLGYPLYDQLLYETERN